MFNKQNLSVLTAGLALFSMFFGAGDLIWPLIIGSDAGNMNFWVVSGFLITAVSLPLLGLCSLMLFLGDYREFFGRIGRWPGFACLLLVQLILGPVGSIPRLFSLSYATLKPYFAFDIGLFAFSILASSIVFLLAIRKHRIVELLGMVLTPILLASIIAIVYVGFQNPPPAPIVDKTAWDAFSFGLGKGYNTLDMIASFIFAPFVLSYFIEGSSNIDTPETKKNIIKKMFYASCIAAFLLSAMYFALSYLASFYGPTLGNGLAKEQLLSTLSLYLLGPYGGLVASLAVLMACLTTAIPLAHIFGDFMRKDIVGEDKMSNSTGLLVTLGVSAALANLGFMGIAAMLEPVLLMLCPALIVLCIVNSIEKLYNINLNRGPVYVTFGLSTIRLFV
jgi:LIVCS family branched-chain amino acid:cation transporter